MEPMTTLPILSVLSFLIIFTGCSRYHVIPDHLEDQVNYQLDFEDVRDNPEANKEEVMVLGGEVLSIERGQDMTRLEVLQLPLKDNYFPADRRSTTQGRFGAFSKGKDPLDPAVLENGIAISMVGEIVGKETISIDQDEKEVPLLAIKDLTIWDKPHYWGRPYYREPWGPVGFRPYVFPY
jgi:starvation-inducible outer membrane lipoprotein